jgi:hypothetical protein
MSWLKLNTPTIYLLVLAIIILVLASIYFYIDYRLKLQTQKINSIASLASTIAEELHNIKVVLSISPDILNSVVSQEKIHSPPSEIINNSPRNITLIDVSDDEDTIDDSDTQSSSSSDESDAKSSNDGFDSEMEEPEYGGSIVINECKDNDETMVLLENVFVKIEKSIPINNAIENTKIVQCADFNDIDNSIVEDLSTVSQSINVVEDLSMGSMLVEVNNHECLVETDVDYSKMPISKLRGTVVELGIVSDASKLKKPELLQLLTSKI